MESRPQPAPTAQGLESVPALSSPWTPTPRHHPVPMGRLPRWGLGHQFSQGPLEVPRCRLASESQRPAVCINAPGMFTPDLPFKLRLWMSASKGSPVESLSGVTLGLVAPTGKGHDPRLGGGLCFPEVDEGPVAWVMDGDRTQTKPRTAVNHSGSRSFPPSSSHLPVRSRGRAPVR